MRRRRPSTDIPATSPRWIREGSRIRRTNIRGEELLVIKEGTLEFVQGNVTNQVAAGGLVFCASNQPHGWSNTSTKSVTYYVIKVYPHDLEKVGQLEKPKSK